MKSLMLILSHSAFTVFAQDDFNQFKKDHMDHLDKKIQLMNQSRSCMIEARSRKALEACGDGMKGQREELRENLKDKKEK